MKQILMKTPDDVVADVFVFSESVCVFPEYLHRARPP